MLPFCGFYRRFAGELYDKMRKNRDETFDYHGLQTQPNFIYCTTELRPAQHTVHGDMPPATSPLPPDGPNGPDDTEQPADPMLGGRAETTLARRRYFCS